MGGFMVSSTNDDSLRLDLTKEQATFLLKEILRKSGDLLVIQNSLHMRVTPGEHDTKIFAKLIRLAYPNINPKDIKEEYSGEMMDSYITTVTDLQVIKDLVGCVKEVPYMENTEKDQQRVRDLKLDAELERTLLNLLQRGENERKMGIVR